MQLTTLVSLALVATAATAINYDARVPLYEWVKHPVDWKFVGRAPADAVVEISVALPHPDPVGLDKLFWSVADPDSPNYRKFLTVEELDELSRPTDEILQPVLAWLKSVRGVNIVTQHGEAIRFQAPAASVEKLFQTKLAIFDRNGGRLIRHVGKTSIPAHLKEHIILVEGLHEFPTLRAIHRIKRSAQKAYTYESLNVPATYYALYGLPATGMLVKNGATAGIFAQYSADGEPLRTDLNLYNAAFGQPPQNYSYNGQADQNVGTEATLDIQMLSTMALNAKITFFMQQNWMYTFTLTLLGLGAKCPNVISVSYGWGESEECSDTLDDTMVCQSHGWSNTQYIKATDLQFMKLGLAGTTMVICSQDQGAPGMENSGCQLDGTSQSLNPVYPASSPYVLSVGSTMAAGDVATNYGTMGAVTSGNPCTTNVFNCTNGAKVTEVSVTVDNAAYGSGGGFSRVNTRPKHQNRAVEAYFASGVKLPPAQFYNRTGRAIPDIAALGGAGAIIQNAQWEMSGGTSMSTPLMAGMITLLNDALAGAGKKPLGPVTPLLYKAFFDAPDAFHHIRVGNNSCSESGYCKYGYAADPAGGWNPITGLGTPVFPKLLAYIMKLLN